MNRRRNRIAACLILIALTVCVRPSSVSIAQAGTPSLATTPNANSCFIGSWRITDQTEFLNDIAHNSLQGVKGGEKLTFRSDGTSVLEANKYVLDFLGKDGKPFIVTEDGNATAHWTRYSAEALMLTKIRAGTMKVVRNGKPGANTFPVFTPYAYRLPVSYYCKSASRMLLTLIFGMSPLVLTRLGSSASEPHVTGARSSAAPVQPVIHAKDSEKPPRFYGYITSSPNIQITMTVLVEKNATVMQNHHFVRRGTTGPKGRFYFTIPFKFRISHSMPVNITLAARDPQTGLTSRALLPPLLLFPPHD